MAQKKSFLLRVDPAIWNEIEAWAADELRSVNGQIEYILKQSIQQRRGPLKTPPEIPAPESPPSEPRP
ncbi:MAG TPA: hypothetical protein VGP72_14300 [Planctomycetota bacterium]|jgi:hypothetical protein